MLLLLDGLAKLEYGSANGVTRSTLASSCRWDHPSSRSSPNNSTSRRPACDRRRCMRARLNLSDSGKPDSSGSRRCNPDLCRVVCATCFRFRPWRNACELVEECLHPRRRDHPRPRAHLEAEELVATEWRASRRRCRRPRSRDTPRRIPSRDRGTVSPCAYGSLPRSWERLPDCRAWSTRSRWIQRAPARCSGAGANVEWTSSGYTQPSTLMDVRKEGAVTSFSAGTARSAFSESTPRAVASATPPCSTSASRVVRANCPPLSPIALWNKPFASGVACVVLILQEPADSPKIVTFAGLPPKPVMLR